jgi:uncharacterized protein YjiS (DUF1127 family)
MTGLFIRLGRQAMIHVARIEAGRKRWGAEAQLMGMSDHELADLNICRSDIPIAVRRTEVVSLDPDRAA